MRMLDTNALSELVRAPCGPVMQRPMAVARDAVCDRILTACELHFRGLNLTIRRQSFARRGDRVVTALA